MAKQGGRMLTLEQQIGCYADWRGLANRSCPEADIVALKGRFIRLPRRRVRARRPEFESPEP